MAHDAHGAHGNPKGKYLAALALGALAFFVAGDAGNAWGQEKAAAPGEGAPEVEVCFSAAERAQPLMKQKRMREARAELEVCARDLCPRAARNDCREWLADVTRREPPPDGIETPEARAEKLVRGSKLHHRPPR